MSDALVVVGAGGFGRETVDVVEAVVSSGGNLRLDGVVDDAPSADNLDRLRGLNVPYLGSIDSWLERQDGARYLLGVGSPPVRRKLDERLIGAHRRSIAVVHPNATLGSEVVLGPGTVICSGVQVSTNVRLGRHVHLNPNATIGHDAVLDDYVSVNPAATVSGECRIGTETLLGAGSVTLQGLTVGTRCVVGAAACVTRDVADEALVKGVPAR